MIDNPRLQQPAHTHEQQLGVEPITKKWRKPTLALVGALTLGACSGSSVETEPVPSSAEPSVAGAENPGEAPVDESAPVDTDPGKQPVGTETTPGQETIDIKSLRDHSNEEIRQWFTLDEARIAALRSAGAHEFAAERGVTGPQEFDPAPWIESFEASPEGIYPMSAPHEDPNILNTVELFPQLNDNLTAYASTIMENDWLRKPADLNPNAVAVHRAFAESILVDSYAEKDLATANQLPTDHHIVTGLMQAIGSLPEDAVITDVSVDVVRVSQGPESADNGSLAMIFYRHDDGTEDAIQWMVTDKAPAPWVVDYSDVLQVWDKYRNEGQSALMLFE